MADVASSDIAALPEAVMAIRLVLFDAFSTLLVPRLPVYVQYSQTFEPYLGVLEPERLKSSFKIGSQYLLVDNRAFR